MSRSAGWLQNREPNLTHKIHIDPEKVMIDARVLRRAYRRARLQDRTAPRRFHPSQSLSLSAISRDPSMRNFAPPRPKMTIAPTDGPEAAFRWDQGFSDRHVLRSAFRP